MELLTILFRNAPYTTGIFRKSANARRTRELKTVLDTGQETNIDDSEILVIAATVKDFFRKMPECIFGTENYDRLIAINDITEHGEKVQAFTMLYNGLPKCSQLLLKHFFCILHHISMNSSENSMNSYNLGVCVGTSLLYKPPDSSKKSQNSPSGISEQELCAKDIPVLFQFIIDNFLDIYGSEAAKLFGELPPPSQRRNDSDSDSMHSLLSMQESTGAAARDDSSMDSIDREFSEQDSNSPQPVHQLSPTNLSRDSGITLSDSHLNDDDELSNSKRRTPKRAMSDDSRLIDTTIIDSMPPKAPPRNRNPRRSSGPTQSIERKHLIHVAVPGTGTVSDKNKPMFSQSMNADMLRQFNKPHSNSNQHVFSKRISSDSLHSVPDSQADPEFRKSLDFTSREIGELKKSSSGARLFFDEEYVNTKKPSCKVHRLQGELLHSSSSRKSSDSLSDDRMKNSSYDYSSQESEPSTPDSTDQYRRVWPPSPNSMHNSGITIRLDTPSKSASTTPNNGSSQTAPHLTVSANCKQNQTAASVGQGQICERRRRPVCESPRRDRSVDSQFRRPEKPPSYQEAIHRQTLLMHGIPPDEVDNSLSNHVPNSKVKIDESQPRKSTKSHDVIRSFSDSAKQRVDLQGKFNSGRDIFYHPEKEKDNIFRTTLQIPSQHHQEQSRKYSDPLPIGVTPPPYRALPSNSQKEKDFRRDSPVLKETTDACARESRGRQRKITGHKAPVNIDNIIYTDESFV